MVKAVLFDLDGTIHDSREVVLASLAETLRAYDLPVPDEAAMIAEVHAGSEHFFRALAPEHDATELSAHFRKLYEPRRSAITTYKNVAETLATLKGQGLHLAVVSSARSARSIIASYNIEQYFDAIVGGDASTARKPDPEPVHIALERLSVPAAEAVIVGDLPADIEAGRAAGLKATIALTHGYGSREMLTAAKPDHLIDSFDELLPLISKL